MQCQPPATDIDRAGGRRYHPSLAYPGVDLELTVTTRQPIPSDDEPLVVDLNQLSRAVLSHPLKVELPVERVDEILAETDAKATRPARIDLDLQFLGDASVLVRGRIDLAMEVPCARCLTPAAVQASAELCAHCIEGAGGDGHGHGHKKKDADDEDDEEIDLDAPEIVSYSGHILDLRPLIAEQVLLAYPMRVLCSRGEACRGLCHACGRNLNDPPSAAEPGCPACGGRGADAEGGAQAEISPWKAALRALQSDEPDEQGKEKRRRGK